MDILEDGSLDLPADILNELDLTASATRAARSLAKMLLTTLLNVTMLSLVAMSIHSTGKVSIQ